MCWPLEATRVHILKRKSTGEERQYLITHKIFIIFFKCMQCWHIGPNHFNVISMLLPIKMHIISAKNGQHGLKVAPLQAWTKRQVYPISVRREEFSNRSGLDFTQSSNEG